MKLHELIALLEAITLYAVKHRLSFELSAERIMAHCIRYSVDDCKRVVENTVTIKKDGIHFRCELSADRVLSVSKMVDLLAGGVA